MKKEHVHLLIVDDDLTVLRSLRRFLSSYADHIYTVNTIDEAEAVLKDVKITHLICDHYLRDDKILGVEIIGGWRREHKNILHAVLLTGSNLESIRISKSIDAKISKSASPDGLVTTLRLQRGE